MKKKRKICKGYNSLLDKIGLIVNAARNKVLYEIDRAQAAAYWQIGMAIVEYEQKGKLRAEYGKSSLIRLSQDLTNKFGKGFSVDNLQNMRKFYTTYKKMFPIYETVSRKSKSIKSIQKYETTSCILSWSHYCELLKEDNPLARSFYEKEAIENNWSVRELKRQMNSMLFERLTLSKNKKKVLQMAKRGQIINRPEDAIKDPYIFGGLDNQIFASKYRLALPSEKQLHKQLGKITQG